MRYIILLLLCTVLQAQDSKNEWKTLPEYKKHHNPFKVLYDIHKHPQRTTVIWMIGAGVAGGLIAWKTRAHCDNYEAGHNGVNVNCVQEIYPVGSK